MAGPAGNRVKATVLRGELSQGLLYPIQQTEEGLVLTVEEGNSSLQYWVEEGHDVSEVLGIKKHVPELPEELKGEAYSLPDAQGRDRIQLT